MKNLKLHIWLLLLGLTASAATAAGEGLTLEQEERVAGFLSMELYVYETTLVGSLEDFQSNAKAHLDYQIMLEEKGIMFGAGPMYEKDATGHPKSGLIIIRANSFKEAKAIADADPFHSSGVRTYTLRKWVMNEGSLDLRVKFSDQKVLIK